MQLDSYQRLSIKIQNQVSIYQGDGVIFLSPTASMFQTLSCSIYNIGKQ